MFLLNYKIIAFLRERLPDFNGLLRSGGAKVQVKGYRSQVTINYTREFAVSLYLVCIYFYFFSCGRQGEPANLISTFIQMHAWQFYSLALTQFFSILESSTTNAWNAKNAFLSPPSRVIWTLDHMKVMHSSSTGQSNLGVDVSIHVELYAISGHNPPQAFLK